MTHTAIPDDELKVFESLKNVKVVFDVGARDDVDYLILKPDIELHAFEPYPPFFEELREQIGDRPNVYLNKFGLGDVSTELYYNTGHQAFDGSTQWNGKTEIILPLITLDSYIQQLKVEKIDFLKIDTEGFEEKIFIGGQNAIKICRYIQFEGVKGLYDRFLSSEFDADYIGGRNYICTRKGEERPWIPQEPKEGGLTDKTERNRLK